MSVQKAEDMLLATLAWRKEYQPGSLHARFKDSLRGEAASGKMFVLPKPDRAGNAVIVMRPGLENSTDVDANIRFLVYTLERAASVSESGKYTVIVDYFTGAVSISNSPSFGVMKATNSILQTHFPERLGVCMFYDAPAFFSALMKMLKPFIDPVTRDKLFFVKREGAALDKHVQRLLDLESTPLDYGGKLAYQFDVTNYFDADKE